MKKLWFVFILLFFISCQKYPDTVILISANAEWKALQKIIRPEDNKYNSSPYGNWFIHTINKRKVIFFHGGWGKIDAAGSTQYVIDRFHPELLVNIGTAGGFPGKTRKGDLVLVTKAVTYDIYEKMGDSSAAVKYYSSDLSIPANKILKGIKSAVIVSADQDLLYKNIAQLQKKYNAVCADWESSAIAHVAKKNRVKCYIFRGITDVVYPAGSNTYGNYSVFVKETEKIMKKLVTVLNRLL